MVPPGEWFGAIRQLDDAFQDLKQDERKDSIEMLRKVVENYEKIFEEEEKREERNKEKIYPDNAGWIHVGDLRIRLVRDSPY